MANDIATIAARLLTALYQIPASADLKKALESDVFRYDPVAALAPLFPFMSGTITVEGLDSYYREKLDQVLHDAKGDNPFFLYLGLGRDFQLLKQQYLRYRAEHVSEYAKNFEQEQASAVLVLQKFFPQLRAAEPALHSIADSFEFVNEIDRLYLSLLGDVAAAANNDYITAVVKQKMYNYHQLMVLRMTQLGKSPEAIARQGITAHALGVMPPSLDRFSSGHDIVSEIGQSLNIPSADITVTAIETALFNRELRAVNQAAFTGVSGERLIQYFERLQHCLRNVKVALAAQAMGLVANQITPRLVMYDVL